MKSFTVALLLFAILIAGVITNAICLSAACEKIYHCATLIERNSSYDSIDELKRYWEEHKYYFTFTVSETKIKRMDELITSLYFASAKNDIYETNRICELIKALSNDIAAYEQPSFEAVF